MEILETKGRKMNKIKREEREDLHTFSDTTQKLRAYLYVLRNLRTRQNTYAKWLIVSLILLAVKEEKWVFQC